MGKLIRMSNPANLQLSLQKDPQIIPYRAAVHAEGENFGYFSLVGNPGLIAQIPELAGEPAMENLVREINAPGGSFETVRMLHYFEHVQGKFRRVLVLGFVFREPAIFAQYQSCLALAGNLLAKMNSGTLEPAEPPLLDIQPAVFVERGVSGWVMDLYLSHVGADEDEARRGLDRLLAATVPFLRTGRVN